MTMRTCLAKIIPDLWFSLVEFSLVGVSLLALAAFSASGSPQTKRAPAHASTKPAAPLPTGLAAMVRAYREAPSAPRRAAIESYATAHPKEAPLARLALGVAAIETRDFAGAIASLRKAQPALAPIADYIAYYLAAARVESKDYDGIAEGLRPVYAGQVTSPFTGRGWILQARAAKDNAPADAVKLLRDHYAELPQPDGDINLADCYLAAGDRAHAAEVYQRIVSQYLAGDAATRASAALVTLKESMGAAYPQPSPQLLLHHADRLLETRAPRQARTEYGELAGQLSGPERDQARVRMGEAEFLERGTASAYPYLRQLDLPEGEADAERLAYLQECTRHLTDDDEMKSTLDRLERHYPRSPWRLKALLSAANRFLLINRPEEFVPLYQAVYQDFPNAPEAALAHWKVTFQAYLHDDPQAQPLLMEHARGYPDASYRRRGALLPGPLVRAFRRPRRGPRLLPAAHRRLGKPLLLHAGARAETGGRRAQGGHRRVPGGLSIPAAQPVPQEAARATALRIARSRLLRSAGLSDIADSELRFGARNGGQPALLGMEMAGSAEAPHLAMHIMKSMAPEYLSLPFNAAPRKYWELLFPLPYRADLERARTPRESTRSCWPA